MITLYYSEPVVVESLTIIDTVLYTGGAVSSNVLHHLLF